MAIGFDEPLYVLPFDHRASFQTNLLGWKGVLTAEQTARVAASKEVVYDGFKAALAMGVPKEKAGILVVGASAGLRDRINGVDLLAGLRGHEPAVLRLVQLAQGRNHQSSFFACVHGCPSQVAIYLRTIYTQP